MTIDLTDILRTLGTTGIIVAALAWLSRALFSHLLTRELSNSSIRLKAGLDRQLEDLKIELRLRGDREVEAVKSRAARELETARLDVNNSPRWGDFVQSKLNATVTL